MQGHQFHPDSLTSQSTRSRLHLHCRNSCGNTISMIPFIIFVFFWIWQPWHVPLVAGEMVCSTVPTKPARSRIPWSRVGYKIFISELLWVWQFSGRPHASFEVKGRNDLVNPSNRSISWKISQLTASRHAQTFCFRSFIVEAAKISADVVNHVSWHPELW